MFKTFCFSLLLITSWSCFGQVPVIGGTATNIGPSAAIAPLISTPDIALPGSGPAVGAPLASAAANDSRFPRGPAVYNPNGLEYVVPAPNVAGASAVPGSESKNASVAERFEFGIQHFQSESTSSGAPPVSLGEIARNYRSQRHQSGRIYSNDNIVQMNAGAVATDNPGAGSTAQSSTSQIAIVVAENRAPDLPQSDREITARAQFIAQRNKRAIHQRDQLPDQDAVASATSTATLEPATATGQTSPEVSQPSKLQQTSSFVFVLSLVGGVVLVGVLYWMQR